jgi:23S rRNA (cytosine1962-C5)-methyltransferase
MQTLPKVILKRQGRHGSESGHPWVFQSEIDYVKGNFKPGDIVDVFNSRRHHLGRGYINPQSQISIRLLSREEELIDRDFFVRRISRAWNYRQRFLEEPEYCRLIFSEADFLPGLIVDKFGPCIVLQTLALGMDVYKNIIVSVLDELLQPEMIYERNDAPVRILEGLSLQKGFLKGKGDTLLQVRENGLLFYADIENGQKTGFFYDQRENRRLLSKFVAGNEVLDCFCFTGSFSIHAAAYGASHVLGIDISSSAVEMAKKNAGLNRVKDRCEFREANAFDLLREYSDAGRSFDTVILDPPAFTKSKSSVENAIRGYKEINLRGLKMIRSGGYLVTCSCSFHMDRNLFRTVVAEAAADAKRLVREVAYLSQAKDHPALPAAPETSYLKFMVLEVQ